MAAAALSETEVRDQLRTWILRRSKAASGVELKNDTPILESGLLSSLDVVELVMALEEEFDIEVPDQDVEGIRTVGDVESYVVSRVS